MTDAHRPTGPGGIGPLADTYEIESELHHDRSIVTYVAKQRDDGRRVTISVLEAGSPTERNALTHLAADARMLTGSRHPHVIPVLETRWLAANRLALVRVHLRGATLRQTLDNVGPLPEARAVEVLTELGDVLDWAARSGIVHRNIDSECICFQKGNGKVMVSFGLPALLEGTRAPGGDDTAFLFERCADGMTLARLGYEMLTAHQPGDASVEDLRAVRADLAPRTVDAIEAGLRCGSGTPPVDARRFVTLLTGTVPAIGAAAVATAASAPVVPRGATAPVPPPQLPLGGPPDGATQPVVPSLPHHEAHRPHAVTSATGPSVPYGTRPSHGARRRRRGGGLLIASLLALAVLVGGTFYLIGRDRDASRIAANAIGDAEDAGDVELPPDPGALTVTDPATDTTSPAEEPELVIPPGGTPAPLPADVEPATPTPTTAARPAPSPLPPAPREQPPARNLCESPSPSDQRACFERGLAARDAELNSVYQALVRELGSRQGDRAVEALRDQQRAWIADRERRCRDAGTGATWAVERVDCLGRISDARALSLARELARVRSGL